MRCPACGHEFKNPVAQAGGRAGGSARVAKGFAMVGQPSAAARKRGWKKRKALANAAGQARAVASRPEPACSTIGGTPCE